MKKQKIKKRILLFLFIILIISIYKTNTIATLTDKISNIYHSSDK